MVFEKIKKLFLGEPEKREVRKLTLEELEKEARKLKKDAIESAKRNTEPLLEEIRRIKENIISLVESLAQAESTDEIHPRLYKSAMEARRLLVDKATRAAKEINPPSGPTWQELMDFNKSLVRTSNLLSKATISHGRYVRTLFRREIEQLMQLTNRLQSLIAQLNSTLNQGKSRSQKFEDIPAKIARRRELTQKTEELQGREKTLKDRIAKLEKTRAEESKELKNLVESEDFKALEGLKQKRREIERELRRMRNSIRSSISGLSRPFRKMRKLASTGDYPLGRDMIKTLDSYLDDPLKTSFSEDEGHPKLTDLLENLQKVVEEEKIKLDSRERRKTNERAKDILEHKTLAKLRAGYEREESRLKELEERRKSSPLLDRKDKLEHSISEHESKLDSAKSDLKAIQDELAEVKKQVEGVTSELKETSRSVLGLEIEGI
jgi:hypothetical protein